MQEHMLAAKNRSGTGPVMLSATKQKLLAALRAGKGSNVLAPSLQLPPPAAGLSEIEMSIWASEHLGGGTALNNVGACYDIEGALSPALLGRALKAVQLSHESLRCAFLADGATVRRTVAHDLDVPLRQKDFSRLDERTCAASLEQLVHDCMAQPFDLQQPPLWRALLVKSSDAQWTFVVVAHHLIVDATSLAIFIRALGYRYGELALADPAGPAPPPPSPARADRRNGNSGPLNPGHFIARLVDTPPLCELPRRDVTHDATSYACQSFAVSFGADTTTALARFSTAHALTPFESLLSAFGTVAARLSNQTDVAIGIPVLLREGSELDENIGCFVNLLPFRFSLDDDAEFGKVARCTAAAFRSDLQYRFTPFHRIVAATGAERAPGRHPLAQIVFTMHGPLPILQLGGSHGRGRVLARTASLFDLSINVVADADDMVVGAEYRSAIFSETDIRELLQAFRTCLTAACADPQMPATHLRLMSDEAWRTAAYSDEVRFTESPPPLSSILATEQPAHHAIAVVAGAQQQTYQDLDRHVRSLAARLRAAGVKPGDRVAVLLERRLELPAALLSVLRLSAAYIPLDPTLPPSGVSAILEDARPRVVLTSPHAGALFADALTGCAIVDATGSSHVTADLETRCDAADNDDASAYVIYTSGSTGRPKGVDVSRRSLASLLAAIRKRLNFSADNVMLSSTTISFDIGTLEIFLPIASGGRLILAEASAARDPWALLDLMRSQHPTHFQATPSLFRVLINSCGWQGSPTLTLLCGGETLPNLLASALRSRCAYLFNMYGPTETTIWSTMAAVSDPARIDVGEPLERTRVYVLDRWNQIRPRGTVGQIAIGGDGVAKGYLGLAQLTQSRFVPDPVDPQRGRVFLTGDIGLRGLADQIEVHGRDDDLVKIRGFRVELRAIEAVLAAQPGVAEAAAFPVRSPESDDEQQLCAALVCTSPLELEAVRGSLQSRLPHYMVPHHLFEVKSLPLTANGKISREVLVATWKAFGAKSETASDVAAVEDPMLGSLVRLFARHTGRQPRLHDDLVALGGDSITAIRLLADVRREFDAAIPVAAFLDGPRTIARLASLIRNFDSAAQHRSELLRIVATLTDEEAERELGMPPQCGRG